MALWHASSLAWRLVASFEISKRAASFSPLGTAENNGTKLLAEECCALSNSAFTRVTYVVSLRPQTRDIRQITLVGEQTCESSLEAVDEDLF